MVALGLSGSGASDLVGPGPGWSVAAPVLVRAALCRSCWGRPLGSAGVTRNRRRPRGLPEEGSYSGGVGRESTAEAAGGCGGWVLPRLQGDGAPSIRRPATAAERWQSGRSRRSRKPKSVKADRGFESHPLRQIPPLEDNPPSFAQPRDLLRLRPAPRGFRPWRRKAPPLPSPARRIR